MKKRLCNLFVVMALFSAGVNNAVSQNEPVDAQLCKTSEMMNLFLEHHPEAKQEQEQNEIFTKQFIAQSKQLLEKSSVGGSKYIIPCVFHVYGTTQGGKTVSL